MKTSRTKLALSSSFLNSDLKWFRQELSGRKTYYYTKACSWVGSEGLGLKVKQSHPNCTQYLG